MELMLGFAALLLGLQGIRRSGKETVGDEREVEGVPGRIRRGVRARRGGLETWCGEREVSFDLCVSEKRLKGELLSEVREGKKRA